MFAILLPSDSETNVIYSLTIAIECFTGLKSQLRMPKDLEN